MLKEETVEIDAGGGGMSPQNPGGHGMLCDSCQRAPAVWVCKADAASLCSSCDFNIHSANPLARRHQRFRLEPFFFPNVTQQTDQSEEDENEAASWLLLYPGKNSDRYDSVLGGEVDGYLNLVDYNQDSENRFGDELNQYQHAVPFQCGDVWDHHNYNSEMSIDFEATSSQNSSCKPINPCVSVDAAVVPESTRPTKGTVDLFTARAVQMLPQFTSLDREAKVLRYKEKKKARKFEKTIRYASRKAYAEIRPRIKGRFAKRTDVDVNVDDVLSSAFMTEPGYGVVPSF